LIQLQSQEGFRNAPPLGDTQTTTTSTTAVAGLPIDVTNLDLTVPSSSSSSTSAQEKKKPGRLDTDLEWINQPMTEDSLESLEKWLGSQSSPPAFITQTRSDVHTETQTQTQTQKEVDKGGNSVGAITVVETGTMENVDGDKNGVAASTAAAAATTATAAAAISSAPTSNAGGSTTENGANLEISDRLFNMLRAGGVDVIEPVSRAIFLAINKAPKAYVGRKVKKMFPGYGEYVGRICKVKR
jgi:ABC-type phosphate transport system substrate-binding protein